MITALLFVAYAMNPFEEVQCPLGDDYARVFAFTSQNQLGGYDSDLASYAKGEQFRTFAIATCYDSYFSLYGSDFSLTLTAEQTEKIQKSLIEAKKTLRDPKNPLIWERYEIAATMYRTLDYPPEFLAQIYLDASWTVRDSFVGFHQGLDGPKSAREILELGPKELEKSLSPEQRKLLVFNLARVAHRAGYPAQRDSYLTQFSLLENLSDSDRNGLDYVRNIVIPKERYYQEKARVEFQNALKNPKSLSEKKQHHTRYLLADLHRRLGDPTTAKPLYEAVRSQGTDKLLIEMSDFFLQE
jgi:uncharacterized protein (DUF2225 family)